mmetsp:Transcript_55416/g.104026  ORF Transcript_55416/g.104026 Transcript_55416/m.104026 type:complete len:230 (+) Transcript_55416:17-706(+)
MPACFCCDGCWKFVAEGSSTSSRTPGQGNCPEGLVGASGTATEGKSKPPLSLEARIAARQEDTETLDLLTTVLRRSISGMDEQGRTLLYYAVRGNRDDSGVAHVAKTAAAQAAFASFSGSSVIEDVPSYLVKRRNFDVNFRVATTGLTPLMEASRFGNVGAVELLLVLRANPMMRDLRGNSALDIARSRLPEYLHFQEMQCSENRWTAVKEHVDGDRDKIVTLLQRSVA